MVWLGVDSASGLHSAQLKPNESALETGVHAATAMINAISEQ